jgi:glycosyltransferase involved in cell wall biosynthesis
VRCLVRDCDMRCYTHKMWRCIRQLIQKVPGKMPHNISCFIFVSEFSRNILEKYLPKHPLSRFIPNPIDVPSTHPAFVSDNRIFIYVGRLSKEKGVLGLAKAFQGKDAKLVFVGDGDCRHEILRILPDADITGWVNADLVKEHLRAARALILPSICYETQGMVVLEAAAQGVPAIVPDTCAAKDLVKDGETGLWFRGGNFNDLLKKLSSLEDNSLGC